MTKRVIRPMSNSGASFPRDSKWSHRFSPWRNSGEMANISCSGGFCSRGWWQSTKRCLLQKHGAVISVSLRLPVRRLLLKECKLLLMVMHQSDWVSIYHNYIAAVQSEYVGGKGNKNGKIFRDFFFEESAHTSMHNVHYFAYLSYVNTFPWHGFEAVLIQWWWPENTVHVIYKYKETCLK